VAEETIDPLLDDIQTAAWSGMIRFLLTKDEVVQQFEAETGIIFPKARSGIERMIDEQCGFDPNDHFVRQFAPWATANYWGDESDITPGIAAALERMASAPARPTARGGACE